MAGYAQDFSKSNNAYQAEREGKITASALAKILKCKPAAIKNHCNSSEFHHTSSWFNSTDYYDEPILIALASGASPDYIMAEYGLDDDDVVKAQTLLSLLRAFGREKVTIKMHEKCDVAWLEWLCSRNFAKCKERREKGCRVTIKGQTATITLSEGSSFQKRLATRGFSFRPEATI